MRRRSRPCMQLQPTPNPSRSAMTRQPKNEAFARTSFLQGANAAYIEEMQAQYERNPGSVSDEWRHFFASLQEERRDGHEGPSWAKPLEQVDSEGDKDL